MNKPPTELRSSTSMALNRHDDVGIKQNINRKPPIRSNHSNVVINLDKNKINLRRRSRLLPRPLSLPSSFKALRLFPHARDRASVRPCTRLTTYNEGLDINFIKALEDEIYRTKAELTQSNKIVHTRPHDNDKCFCCGKRGDSPAIINTLHRQKSISNNYSSEHGVQLRRKPEGCNSDKTANEKILLENCTILRRHEIEFRNRKNRPSCSNRRRSRFKWIFFGKRKKVLTVPSIRQRSYSWPNSIAQSERSDSFHPKHNRLKPISKSSDNLPINWTCDKKSGYRRWPWLDAIYLWGRRNSFRGDRSKQTNNDDDCIQNNRSSVINKHAPNRHSLLGNRRQSSSFRLKRQSDGSTTSTTDVVKAWVYRRRFLLIKYTSFISYINISCFFSQIKTIYNT